MDAIVCAPVSALLGTLGEPESGVGAGAAAAIVAAVAAAICQGVARASVEGWDEAAGLAAQAEALADRLAALADDNSAAYRRAREALAGGLSEDGQERRDHALGQLLERSASLPARIGACAADVAELAAALAGRAAPEVRPDARAAALLAAAAADAARLVVEANLAVGAGGPLVQAAREAALAARAAAGRA